MSVERTLSIIKPDAVGANHIGEICARLEKGRLKIVASKMLRLTKERAESFYAVHRDRPFFAALIEFISSGPVLVQVLEGEDAIACNRKIMGATDPAQAAPGTVRADFASSIDENAVHGSDSLDTAKVEVAFFFSDEEICARTR